MVQNVEEISAQRELKSFGQRERLLQIQVGVEVSRPAECIAGVGVKPRGECEAACREASRVRTVCSKCSWSSWCGFVQHRSQEGAVDGQIVRHEGAFLGPVHDAEGKSSAVKEGAGNLPSTDERIQ